MSKHVIWGCVDVTDETHCRNPSVLF